MTEWEYEIDGRDMRFAYEAGVGAWVLDGVDFQAGRGEIVAVLGRNGSGKSTMARCFNALLSLTRGSLTVRGVDATDEREIWRLRRMCGMVFQNPENQFVSSVLEEDVAFGLENYQTPRSEIPRRVSAALARVGLGGYEKRAPRTLSGGQKQRAALAGALALEPDILIFDEATSMLDPQGRREIVEEMRALRDVAGKTVVLITHYVEEAAVADKVVILSGGKVVGQGEPRDALSNREWLKEAGLTPPFPVRMYYDLLEAGVRLARCPLTQDELVEEICRLR